MTPLDSNSLQQNVKRAVRKARKRSKEAMGKKRQKYLEILSRSKQKKGTNLQERDHKYICKHYYRKGYCDYGARCRFSHSGVSITKKELKLCKFFLQGDGACKFNASECKYSHDPSLFMCRINVMNGSCNNPDSCAFKHMDSESIASLDDTEKLRFCYNNKGFLTRLLAQSIHELGALSSTPDNNEDAKIASSLLSIDPSKLAHLPWYLQYVHILLLRDNELSERD